MEPKTMFRSTTILAVRRGAQVALGGDGQVTMNNTIVKHKASKVRRLGDGDVLIGFAGAAADGFTLMERFEGKLKEFRGDLQRAAVEMAKDWRSDKYLRRLEAIMAVCDKDHSLLLSGTGDVVEPDDGILSAGSGGPFALSAARALLAHSDLSAREIVEQSLKIAAGICIYTNENLTIETL
jgi:ATP-dependent HslUV protease subunit HslV